MIFRSYKVKVSVTNKEIIRLAAPISLSLFIPQINFLTNTAFLGRLGEQELGVNGITGVFYLILAMIGAGLSIGVQIQMARRAGEGNKQELAHVLSNSAMLSVAFALGLMMMALWFVPIIFGLSLHNDENILLGVNFLYIRVWGLPFLMMTQLLNSFYIATGQSRYLIPGSLMSTITNVTFDYLLIFGHGGFPAMGFDGAAVASILGEVASCCTLLGVFLFKGMYKIYPVFRFQRFDFKLSQRTLKVASPLIVQFLFSIGGWQVFFIYVEHLGARELAASQILRSIFGIVGIGTFAFATTCNTLVSKVIGKGQTHEVPGVIAKIVKLSLIYAIGISILLLILAEPFLSLYRNDPSLVQLAIPSLRMIVSAMFIMAMATVVFNGVVGTGNTAINLTMEIVCVCTYLVYCYIFIERLRYPLYIAWASEFVYWTSLLILSFAYLRSGRWKGKRI